MDTKCVKFSLKIIVRKIFRSNVYLASYISEKRKNKCNRSHVTCRSLSSDFNQSWKKSTNVIMHRALKYKMSCKSAKRYLRCYIRTDMVTLIQKFLLLFVAKALCCLSHAEPKNSYILQCGIRVLIRTLACVVWVALPWTDLSRSPRHSEPRS